MPSTPRHPGARSTPATGAGAAAAAAPGRRAADPFAAPPPPPKWAPPPAHRAAAKSAAAALDLETRRARALSRLRKHLEAATGRGGLALGGPGLLTFERWLWACRAAGGGAGRGFVAARAWPPPADPVLPHRGDPAPLAADLVRRGAPPAAAAAAAAALARDATAEAAKLCARARALASGKAPAALEVRASVGRHSVELTVWRPGEPRQAAFARLSRSAYRALAARYRRDAPPADPPLAAPVGGVDDTDAVAVADAGRATFHARLAALLVRYRSVGGPGFHAAQGAPLAALLAGPPVRAGCDAFASALNAATARFNTAFPDVDAPFGGVGDFFAAPPPPGAAVTVNPPFEPATLARAARALRDALTAADAAGTRLTAAFITPTWRDGDGWRVLTEECGAWAAAPAPVVVAAADHGYRDGAPHGADRDPLRASPYDSALFVFRSRKAAGAWDAAGWDAAVRTAWAACVPTTAAVERQRARRGGKDVRAWSEQQAHKKKRRAGGGGQAGAVKRSKVDSR